MPTESTSKKIWRLKQTAGMENARHKALESYLIQWNTNGKWSQIILEEAGCNLQPWLAWLLKDEQQNSFSNSISEQEDKDSYSLKSWKWI